MKKIRLFIFDLDGTLLDSLPCAVAALNRAMAKQGIPPVTTEQIADSTHEGVEHMVQSASGLAPGEALQRLVRDYQAEYLAQCADPLYPGVRETLQALYARGCLLAVLSNKPAALVQRQTEVTGLSPWLWRVQGDDGTLPLKPAPDGVRRLAREAGCSPEETVMVGDSFADLEAGRRAGARACFAAYGVGRLEAKDLQGCDRLEDIRRLLDLYP